MLKKGFFLLLLGIFLPFNTQAASGLSQEAWMKQLVYSLAWSAGLPDKPTVEDFARVLSGVRTIRIEAEENYRRTDAVSLKTYNNFGSFSGSGWLSGIATSTQAHLRAFLPHAGRYHVGARVFMAGHQIELAGKILRADGSERFSRVDFGEVELEAGEAEILVRLPPNGGIDYVELSAPPLGPVAPVGGWQPERPLDTTVAARTLVQALGLQRWLPPTGRKLTLEAEFQLDRAHEGLLPTKSDNQGIASGGMWVRTGDQAATLDFILPPFGLTCFSVQVRGVGEAPFEVTLEDLFGARLNFESHLSVRDAGSFLLNHRQGSRLSVVIPPSSGLDSIVLVERRAKSEDLKKLTGLPIESEELTEQQANNLLNLVAKLVASGYPRSARVSVGP